MNDFLRPPTMIDTNLMGFFERKIDDKGRATLPSTFVEQGLSDSFQLLFCPKNEIGIIVPSPEIEQSSITSAFSYSAAPDSTGRVRIPAEMRNALEIPRKQACQLVYLGRGDHAHMMTTKRWSELAPHYAEELEKSLNNSGWAVPAL